MNPVVHITDVVNQRPAALKGTLPGFVPEDKTNQSAEFRKLLGESGLRQVLVAKLLGVSVNYISMICTGRRIPSPQLTRLFRFELGKGGAGCRIPVEDHDIKNPRTEFIELVRVSGRSQAAIAQLLRVTPQFISDISAGRRIPSPQLTRLLQYELTQAPSRKLSGWDKLAAEVMKLDPDKL
jgi:transcriptional regulator with XRE-family HTH domain